MCFFSYWVLCLLALSINVIYSCFTISRGGSQSHCTFFPPSDIASTGFTGSIALELAWFTYVRNVMRLIYLVGRLLWREPLTLGPPLRLWNIHTGLQRRISRPDPKAEISLSVCACRVIIVDMLGQARRWLRTFKNGSEITMNINIGVIGPGSFALKVVSRVYVPNAIPPLLM